jgi:TRAP-type C4-dicarboxylate transport system permease small subunit
MKPQHPLKALAKACSIIGGLVLTALMLMTCYSVVGRNFFEKALIGDFELTGIACGIAMAFFMPLCQLERGNIIVDFFTAKRSARFNHGLDRFGDLLMTVIFVLLSWRSGVAALSAKENMGASMLLGFPDWIVLAGMSIPFALAAVIAIAQTLARFDQSSQGVA